MTERRIALRRRPTYMELKGRRTPPAPSPSPAEYAYPPSPRAPLVLGVFLAEVFGRFWGDSLGAPFLVGWLWAPVSAPSLARRVSGALSSRRARGALCPAPCGAGFNAGLPAPALAEVTAPRRVSERVGT